jgi:peptidyl-prolyl cis-trans isomerase C
MQFIFHARRIFLVVATIVLLCTPPCHAKIAPNPLAIVNGVPITNQDMRQEAAIIAADVQERNLKWTQNQILSLDDEIVSTLVDRELLYQHAQQRNIKIRSPWIERALLELKTQIGSVTTFNAYLKKTGLNEEQLKERIRKGLIVKRLLHRDVLRRIKVSEAEMQAFFRRNPEYFIRKDEVRVRQIFIAFPDGDDISSRGAALLRIQAIQDRLRKGENFAALALEYSDDPSRARGGDLGYLERDQMITAFADAAFALQPGQVSDIVETPFGYHLIKMVDHIPSSHMAYRNARGKIERTLRRNKEKAATARYLAELRKKADIKGTDKK